MGKITEILKLRRDTRILDRLNDELCVKLEALEDEAKELRTRNDKQAVTIAGFQREIRAEVEAWTQKLNSANDEKRSLERLRESDNNAFHTERTNLTELNESLALQIDICHSQLLELRRALGDDYEPEHLEVMATIFPPADSLVGYTLKIDTPSEGEESWRKSDRSWLLATTPSSKSALIRTPIHKDPELLYCLQTFAEKRPSSDGYRVNWRDCKPYGPDGKLELIQKGWSDGDTHLDLIMRLVDESPQLWLGHWNDGVEDA